MKEISDLDKTYSDIPICYLSRFYYRYVLSDILYVNTVNNLWMKSCYSSLRKIDNDKLIKQTPIVARFYLREIKRSIEKKKL